jgi:hypothetical protein
MPFPISTPSPWIAMRPLGSISTAPIRLEASDRRRSAGRPFATATQAQAGVLVEAWVKTGAACPN